MLADQFQGRSRRRFLMDNYTHQTAPTQFVEAGGIRVAYRRFANRRFGGKSSCVRVVSR